MAIGQSIHPNTGNMLWPMFVVTAYGAVQGTVQGSIRCGVQDSVVRQIIKTQDTLKNAARIDCKGFGLFGRYFHRLTIGIDSRGILSDSGD